MNSETYYLFNPKWEIIVSLYISVRRKEKSVKTEKYECLNGDRVKFTMFKSNQSGYQQGTTYYRDAAMKVVVQLL